MGQIRYFSDSKGFHHWKRVFVNQLQIMMKQIRSDGRKKRKVIQLPGIEFQVDRWQLHNRSGNSLSSISLYLSFFPRGSGPSSISSFLWLRDHSWFQFIGENFLITVILESGSSLWCTPKTEKPFSFSILLSCMNNIKEFSTDSSDLLGFPCFHFMHMTV
jgi:hypothetical protein